MMDTTKFSEWAVAQHSSALTHAVAQRRALAGAVTELTWRQINDYANSIAELDGRVDVTSMIVQGAMRLASGEATEADLTQHLLNEFGRSTDDTWSGRSNDARRAFADGRREQLKKVADFLRYGASL